MMLYMSLICVYAWLGLFSPKLKFPSLLLTKYSCFRIVLINPSENSKLFVIHYNKFVVLTVSDFNFVTSKLPSLFVTYYVSSKATCDALRVLQAALEMTGK